MTVTVISGEARPVPAEVAEGRVLLAADDLPAATGWALKPEGLCRGEVCVPVRDASAFTVGDRLDLGAVAEALDRPFLLAEGVAVLGERRSVRRSATDDLRAPSFTLPDLAGHPRSLDEWRGRKKLLVAFASWCGCRYELPGWQALQDELADDDFTVIAVALDESAELVRPWTEGIAFPVLVDREHTLSETYAITNVPTVVWIDEDARIVVPNSPTPGSDLFTELTGVSGEPAKAAIRRWVREGEVALSREEAHDAVHDLTPELEEARLRFRLGAHLAREGVGEGARRQLLAATDLAPGDLTIWRAAMPLLGDDPFGDAFFARFEQWQADGSPYNGLPALED